MSRVLSRSTVLGSVVACIALVATTASAFVAVGWHGLTQTQRNSRIIARAQQDLNQNVGVECKPWVQRVVNSASGGVVTVPRNRDDTVWYSSPDCHRFPQPYNIEWVRPGQIIQMHWRNQRNRNEYPHTAIVLSKNSTGMTWIDSNIRGDNVVRIHDVSFQDFRASVRSSEFNVYEIR